MAREASSIDTPYDRIARWYDVDMGRNMPFDDVGFYARLCERKGGKVLELGCGNGRILLALIRRGIDAVGVDTSRKMLEQLGRKAKDGGIEPLMCQMDVRKLGFGARFDIVLCPYSLVTYMSEPDDLDRLLSGAKRALLPDGLLVVDAFIPKETAGSGEYRLDYRRPFGANVLTRHKRVAPIASRINRIERRYEILSTAGEVLETIETSEDIRTFCPDELMQALGVAGLTQQQVWWDYGLASPATNPQFFTVAAHAPVRPDSSNTTDAADLARRDGERR